MDDKTIVIDRHSAFPPRRSGFQVARQRGFTLNEFLVLLGVFAVIVGLAIPGVLRDLQQARNEAEAVQTLQTLVVSQDAFARSCGHGGYASSISQLQPEVSQPQSGYSFAVVAAKGATASSLDCRGLPTQSDYLLTAEPEKYRSTGSRSFTATRDSIIWQVDAADAPQEPFAEPARTWE